MGRQEIPLTKEELLMSNKLLDMLMEFNKNGHLSFNGIQLLFFNSVIFFIITFVLVEILY